MIIRPNKILNSKLLGSVRRSSNVTLPTAVFALLGTSSKMYKYVAAVSEVQQFYFNHTPDNGTFTITIGIYTTSSIAYDASTTTIKDAIEALSNIGVGNVNSLTGTGTSGDPYVVTFNSSLGDVQTMSFNSSLTYEATSSGSFTSDVYTEGEAGVTSHVWELTYPDSYGGTFKVSLTWDGPSGGETSDLSASISEADFITAVNGAFGTSQAFPHTYVSRNGGTTTIHMDIDSTVVPLGASAVSTSNLIQYTTTTNIGITGSVTTDGAAAYETLVTSASDPIYRWKDAGTSGRDFVQSTLSQRPIYNTSGPTTGAPQAVYFDGADDALPGVSNTPVWNPALGGSVAFWIYPQATSYCQTVRLASTSFSEFNIVLGDGSLAYFLNRTIQFGFRTYKSHGVGSSIFNYTNKQNMYTHLCVTYNTSDKNLTSTFSLYINGSSVTLDGTVTNTLLVGGNNNWLCSENDLSYRYKGRISDIRVYNEALTPAQVARLATL